MNTRTYSVGFTCGAFDPFPHPGHIQMLDEAKSVCERLIVGLHRDPSKERPETKHRTICTAQERRIMLTGLRAVSEVVEYETERDLVELLLRIKPDVRIIGADYRGRSFTGDDLPIPVVFNSRNHDWSSTNFLRRIRESGGGSPGG